MMGRFIHDRQCASCGKRNFLSGLAHIERGYLRTMICYRCLKRGVSLSDFKTKTRANTAKQIAAATAARAANAARP